MGSVLHASEMPMSEFLGWGRLLNISVMVVEVARLLRSVRRHFFFLLFFTHGCYAVELPPFGEPIILPACDTGVADVFLIDSVSDWKEINSPRYRVFCILPGDYTEAGTIELKASGTPKKKRYIRLYIPGESADVSPHPVKLPLSKQAVIAQLRIGDQARNIGVHDWILDRVVIRGSYGANWVGNGSRNNILNRLLIEGSKSTGVLVFDDASHNILQNSVLRNTAYSPDKDYVLIYFSKDEGEQIINNELYNATASAIQQGPNSRSNHVIYGNDIYVAPARYTDCEGNFDSKGKCSCTEVGVVLKGPDIKGHMFRIENNIFWGFRPTDTACGGTGSIGSAINLGSGGHQTTNVLIKGNIIFDSSSGIYLGKNVGGVSIIDNTIHGIGGLAFPPGTAISNLYGHDIEILQNTVVGANYWYRTSRNVERNVLECNTVIDSPGMALGGVKGALRAKRNYLFNAGDGIHLGALSGRYYSSAKESMNKALCFSVKKFTGPVTKCLPYIHKTDVSPARNCVVSSNNSAVTTAIQSAGVPGESQ